MDEHNTQIFHDIIILWPAPVYLHWCLDEAAADTSSLIWNCFETWLGSNLATSMQKQIGRLHQEGRTV